MAEDNLKGSIKRGRILPLCANVCETDQWLFDRSANRMLACAPDAILINWRVRNRRRFGLVSMMYGVHGSASLLQMELLLTQSRIRSFDLDNRNKKTGT